MISIGWCQNYKTHPLSRKFGHRFDSIHSETDCILKSRLRPAELYKYDLVNIRLTPSGLGLAKPCRCCQLLLHFFRIGHVYYTDMNGKLEEL